MRHQAIPLELLIKPKRANQMTEPAERAPALWADVCEVVMAWHGKDAFDIYRDHSPEMKRIKSAIDALAAQSGWIPVSERLPDVPSDAIVGHKTFSTPGGGFRHEPLRADEAATILKASDDAKAKRASDMPTEQDAVRAMWSAYQRLRELGWKETCYGPTNEVVRLIEAGSSGIHEGSRHEPWPEKTWWIADDDDLWPSMPILWKATQAMPNEKEE